MESFASFRAKLLVRREELRRVGALVDPVRLLDAIVADFDEASGAETEPLLNLTQAARECGYSPDALGRMVRSGRIPNLGRPGAPRVRRTDLPRKAGLPLLLSPDSPPETRAYIARAALTAGTDRAERLA